MFCEIVDLERQITDSLYHESYDSDDSDDTTSLSDDSIRTPSVGPSESDSSGMTDDFTDTDDDY